MSQDSTDSESGKGFKLGLIAAAVAGIVIAPASLVTMAALEEEENAAAASASCSGPNGGQALPVVTSGSLPTVLGYSAEQVGLAATIMTVAEEQGLAADAQLIGLITAMQESTLGINTEATGVGDAGPFQQRTLAGWYGSPDQVMDPVYAATAFFTGVTATSAGDYGSVGGGTGYGHIPGLIDIPGWQTIPPGQAAQAVQRSAFPGAYQDHIADAQRIMSALSGVEVNIDASTCTEPAASGDMATAIERGRSLLGTSYDFGGGDENGPSPYGIDCSGFVMYALAAAGITGLPRTAQQQFDYFAGNEVSEADIQPGDLIFYARGRTGSVGSADAISHVAMYTGDGQHIEATRYYSGSSEPGVIESTARLSDDSTFVGIRRPTATNTN